MSTDSCRHRDHTDPACTVCVPPVTLIERVRLAILADGGVRSLDQTAKILGMSGRSLKRRLQVDGTTFSRELDQVRKERAQALIVGGMSLKDVAEQLGYASHEAFGRAFRRLTGITPAAYRRSTR